MRFTPTPACGNASAPVPKTQSTTLLAGKQLRNAFLVHAYAPILHFTGNALSW